MGDVLRSLLRWMPDSGWTWGSVLAVAFVAGGWAAQYWEERSRLMDAVLARPLWLRAALFAVCAGAVMIFSSQASKPFIYFQF